MATKTKYSDSFFQSLNKLTGIPMSKLKSYAKENNPFNILEHPGVVEPSYRQLEKINKLNEFIASYNVLKLDQENEKITFKSPNDSGKYFASLLGGVKDKERFLVAFLDNSNSIIELRTVSQGTTNMAVVYPRDILKMALANDCSSIMLSHNHPGGSLKASSEDIALTQRIVDIFRPLDIKVLDHIIVGGYSFSSMAENGVLPNDRMDVANYEPIKLSAAEENQVEYTSVDEEIEL
ncbi:JAB domain-containing protein [Alkaliphilus serpentinus]|uniref:JAB domain-containing protein n=1 Tax=Alkaliphilus serpentinus TaxID=1482731 RepID=A0A833HM38_9FIRM|nr:JAB domain-containing protein [Alkaliphilus serpentinus]KAB3527104.1 JAB domain-containing protein [Alkaliphilus serpentinus]